MPAFVRRTLHQADRHNIPFLASALTFDALLATIPFLLLLLVALTHVLHLSPRSTSQDLHQLFQRLVPHATGGDGAGVFASIEAFLLGFTRARRTVSLYAIPLFLWFATRLFASVRTALTLVYDVPRRPGGQHFLLGYLRGKLRDAAMVLVAVALGIVNTMLSGGLRLILGGQRKMGEAFPGLGVLVKSLGRGLTELVAFAFSVSVFYLVFRHASPRRLPRRAALAGSIVTALLFEFAKRGYGWYLENVAVVQQFAPDARLGAAILFVVWLYYTALVFLLGAVVAETWDLRSRAPDPAAVPERA